AFLDRLPPITPNQLGIALRTDLAGRHLRAQIAQACLRIADIVADDLVKCLVELTCLVDLERSHLQAFAEDVGGGIRAEALPSAADIHPVGAVCGKANQLAIMEAGC